VESGGDWWRSDRVRWLFVFVVCAGVAYAEDVNDKVASEAIGPIRHGMTDKKVATAAGAPKKRGIAKYAGEATADWEKDWSYAGATITFHAAGKAGPLWLVRRIEVAKGSKWKTKRGIGIGSTRAQVEKAYANVKDTEHTKGDRFVAGSIYGGVIFSFVDDKVATIFVGAESF
jgi:hypothetical protein